MITPKAPKWFKALKSEPRERQVLAFDIEGVGGPGGFVCGSIVGDTIYSFFTDRAEMLKALLDLGAEGYWIFSHNLQYDLPVLEGEQFPLGSMLFSPSTLLWSDYEHWGKRVRLYDSRNLFPRHTAESLGALVNAPKVDLDPQILRRLSKGAAWSQFNLYDREKIRKYVCRDAEIVYLAISQLQELALYCGGQLRPTIAGISMDIYRRHYHKWPWPVLGAATNETARPAYYGGRVENFCYGRVPGVNSYDITSLYPYAQSVTKFPHPGHLKLELAPRSISAWEHWEGVAMARVKVPEDFIPALPYRFDGRLFFPTGEISGLWTILEIRDAMQAGVELVGVDWVLGTPTTFNPFVDFVEALFNLRQAYLVQGSSQANLIKLILNSLYGRFGMNPEHNLYQLISLESPPDWEELQGYSTHVINNHLYGYGPVPVRRPPDYVNVLFAAQITAAGRSILQNELANQGEQAVYCDTDSILTRGTIQTGEGLGDWRLEYGDIEADLLGPKEYALHNEIWGDKYTVKGVPPEVAEAYFKDGAARFFRALNIREALNQGKAPSTWVETYREHSTLVPKRAPVPPWVNQGISWTGTRPYSREELAGVLAGTWVPPDPFEGVQETLRPQGPPPEQVRLFQ